MTGRIIDGDQHLHEPGTMWRDYIDPSLRDAALAIEDDELGYAWLTWRGARLYPAEIQVPGKPSLIKAGRLIEASAGTCPNRVRSCEKATSGISNHDNQV